MIELQSGSSISRKMPNSVAENALGISVIFFFEHVLQIITWHAILAKTRKSCKLRANKIP